MVDKMTEAGPDKFLNDVFKSEPAYSLPDNFADMVAEKVSHRFAWESYFKEFLIYLGVMAGVLTVAISMAFIWFAANLQEWGTYLLDNISWVAGANILVVFILFADRVLLRYLFYRTSPVPHQE